MAVTFAPQASSVGKLSEAAPTLGDALGALRLRLLPVFVDVPSEKNTTPVTPFPVGLLRVGLLQVSRSTNRRSARLDVLIDGQRLPASRQEH